MVVGGDGEKEKEPEFESACPSWPTTGAVHHRAFFLSPLAGGDFTREAIGIENVKAGYNL